MAIGLNHNTQTVKPGEELFFQIGHIFGSSRIDRPDGFLSCDGSSVSRESYSRLFNVICPIKGTITISIQSPGVVTLINHGFLTGESIFLTSTGALPTGLSQNTLYYVNITGTNTFTLSSSHGGSAINTSGSQNGVHTIYAAPYGIPSGVTSSTHFNVPDLNGTFQRGRGVSVGYTQDVTIPMGIKIDDANLTHSHDIPIGYMWNGNIWNHGTNYTNDMTPTIGTNNNNGRTASEARPKSIGVNYFIKF